MKPIQVKTIFNGQIAFPEKYYYPAQIVKCGSEYMSLNGKKPTGYSEYMDDKFGRGKYRLVYFDWKPDDIQPKLL